MGFFLCFIKVLLNHERRGIYKSEETKIFAAGLKRGRMKEIIGNSYYR